jgi:hypothetical protein
VFITHGFCIRFSVYADYANRPGGWQKMTAGCYLHLFKRYFDAYKNEWKFDLDTADVKVMFLTDEYCPNSNKHKYVDQIKNRELRSEDVEIKVHGKKVIAPNGYETGGKSIGAIYSTQYTQKCLNNHDDWEDWTTTTLIAKEEKTVWGGDDELEKYPYKATFNVGVMVYYLNKGTDASSPLIAYFTCEHDCYKGTYTMNHNSKGFINAHVNESQKHLFKEFGINWGQGFICRKKKRGEND